jgi:hypothetical protein
MTPTTRAILHRLAQADPQGLDRDALDDLHLKGLKPALASLVKLGAIEAVEGIYRIGQPGREMLQAGQSAASAPTAATLPPMVEHIVLRPPAELRPDPRNARTHDEAQIACLVASIREYGFNLPIGIDESGGVLAGHGRREAALRLGLPRVPCVVLSHLSPAARRAYMIADNRIADLSSWDDAILLGELRAITAQGIDLTGIGYDEQALRDLADSVHPPPPGESESATTSYDVVVDCDSAAKRRKAMKLLKDAGFSCHPFNKA